MADPLYSGRYTQAWTIAASDTQPVHGPIRGDGTNTPYCSGVLALTSGNVTARFLSDRANASVTFPVSAGTVYPFALTYVYSASTATLLGLL